jgi:hypothetical protein
MSVRNILATHNLLAISANVRESAINTEQTLDTCMLVAMDDIINLDNSRRVTNADEAIGKEEPDAIYDIGALAEATFNFNKAQPQHFAFIMAYALGQCSSAAAGTTGYKHTITPIIFDLDTARSNPSFTAAMRYGNQVLKRLFASMFVDSFTASFPKDDWVKISATIKGTGKVTANVEEETLSALDNATEITLAANGVQGADAATRLANVHRIYAEYPSTGVWTEVTFSAVSDATPAAITITSLGGSGASVSYKVLYVPTESGWMSFPSRINETPLRVVQLLVNTGGKWDGSSISGGRQLAAELKSLEWSFNNGITPEFTPGSGNLYYADRAIREGRSQSLSLGREFRDYIYQNHIDLNDTFVVYMIAEGAEYESGHKYTVEVVFPQVAVMTAPIGVDGKRLSEDLTLQVMEDDTYGSIVAYVKNKQEKYAAAS